MRRRTSLLLSGALVSVACASDRAGDGHAPVHEARGGSSGTGGEATSGGSGAAGESSSPAGAGPDGGGSGGADAGGGGEAGSDAAGRPPAAGAGGEGSSGTDPPPVHELCPREPSFGTAQKLSVSTEADERFGGITPDELVIAWTVTAEETVTLFVASRDNVDAAFGSPVSAAIEGALDDQVALSADGLRVAFVNADRRGFSVISRPTLDDAFGVATQGEFSLFDATGGGLPAGQNYAEPVLAGDGVSFYYSRYGDGLEDTLRVSSRLSDTDSWPAGGPLPATELAASDDGRFAPTGASRDGRTLFLWDTAAASEVMAFVDPDSAKFEPVADIGARRGAVPNGACTRLYYGAADPSLDLFVVPVGE